MTIGRWPHMDEGECWALKLCPSPQGALSCEEAGRHGNGPYSARNATAEAYLWQLVRKYLFSELLTKWRPLSAVAGGESDSPRVGD